MIGGETLMTGNFLQADETEIFGENAARSRWAQVETIETQSWFEG